MTDTTYFPTFDTAGGTRKAPQDAPEQDHLPQPVAQWLRSEAAQDYEGLWVLFDEGGSVLDADLSPTALRDRHQDLAGGLVIYIEPRRTLLGA